MCHYITGLLSPDADSSAVGRVAKSHLRKWQPLEKHSLRSTLRDGETYYLTTRGMCDCGTGLGVLTTGTPREPNYQRKAKRLRKKGWSETKIELWLDGKRRELEKIESRNADYLTNPPVDVVHWKEFISDVLDANLAEYVGLIVHWYDGLIETERINITDRRWIPYEEVSHEYLLRAEEDVIHTFCVHHGPGT